MFNRPKTRPRPRNIVAVNQSEETLDSERKKLLSIFESIDELIYVSDPNTYEILFMSRAMARKHGNVEGQKCYQAFHNGLSPCSFCTNEHIFGENTGKPYIWEFQDKADLHWYRCLDRAIRWSDGRMVRYEMAMDITEAKMGEQALRDTLEMLRKAVKGTIQAIGMAIEMRDPYTAGHQRRVADLARAIAQEMNLPKDQIDGIRMAALIHDIGKISIPAEILSRPNRLSEMEFNLIKNHPQIGYDILESIEFQWPIARIVLQHHERINGSGYPLGLSDNEILTEAKILAVADVVEAMMSHRPYRPALGLDIALEEISKNKGLRYDPKVVDACLKLFNEKGFKFREEALQAPSLI